MHPRTNRPRGRAVPPPRPAPEPQAPPAPLSTADELDSDLGIVELRFTPPLTLAAFRRFATRHGFVYTPLRDEPQIFRSPGGVEVAFGIESVLPLPRQVNELWLTGVDGHRVDAILALVATMLRAWPHARWTADGYGGFTSLLRRRFPDREGAPAP